MAVSAAAHQLPLLSPLTASALASLQHPELLMPEASAALALLRLRPEASAALPLAASVISEASEDLAGLVTLPLLVLLRPRRLVSVSARRLVPFRPRRLVSASARRLDPFRPRRQASGQHLLLAQASVLPASLRLRS